MLQLNNSYSSAKDSEALVQCFVLITTTRTRYIFGLLPPSDAILGTVGNVGYWDGTVLAGDGGTFGGLPIAYSDGRVIDFGNLRQTLAPQSSDLITSLSQAEIGSYSVNLDNTDDFFTVLLGDDRDEPILGQELTVMQGFAGESLDAFATLFTGQITQLTLTDTRLNLVAEALSTIAPEATTSTPLYAWGLKIQKLPAGIVFLLHSDTTHGSTTFVDSGPNALTISAGAGTPIHSTAQSKWGSSSLYFDGSSYLNTTSSSVFAFNNSDFTIEFWIYRATAWPSGDMGWLGATSGQWDVWKTDAINGYYYNIALDIKGNLFATTGYGQFGYGAWQHWAFVYASRILSFYRDGVKWGASVGPFNAGIDQSTGIRIGGPVGWVVPSNFVGFLDEIAIWNLAKPQSDFPPSAPYAGAANPILAQATYTHAQCATAFFTATDWFCSINFRKDDLSDVGILFSLVNQTAADTTLIIGIDASNHPYCTTGQDIESSPAVTTYTSTQTLDSVVIGKPVSLRVFYSETNSTILFVVNGVSDTQAAAAPYDKTGTASEEITLGNNFGGTILNLNFNDRFWVVNNKNDDTLTALPDILGGLDLTVVDGEWVKWS